MVGVVWCFPKATQLQPFIIPVACLAVEVFSTLCKNNEELILRLIRVLAHVNVEDCVNMNGATQFFPLFHYLTAVILSPVLVA